MLDELENNKDINDSNNELNDKLKNDLDEFEKEFKESEIEEEFDDYLEDDSEFAFTKEEKEKIAEENMRLIIYVVKKFDNYGTTFDELESSAVVGYAKALNGYRKNKKTKFSTYAIRCIKNEILYSLRKEKKHIVNDVSLNSVLSMDKNGNNLELEDIIFKDELLDIKSLEDWIIDGENKVLINKALLLLSEKEQYILKYRYGLDRGIVKTQNEIAKNIGMSQANISKMEKTSLKKLRRILQKHKFIY